MCAISVPRRVGAASAAVRKLLQEVGLSPGERCLHNLCAPLPRRGRCTPRAYLRLGRGAAVLARPKTMNSRSTDFGGQVSRPPQSFRTVFERPAPAALDGRRHKREGVVSDGR